MYILYYQSVATSLKHDIMSRSCAQQKRSKSRIDEVARLISWSC